MKLLKVIFKKCFRALELAGNFGQNHKSTRNKSKNKMGLHQTKVSPQKRKPQSAETDKTV